MTDPDRSDELVSAHLDGEATVDEAARVEGDPVLLARFEVLRGASAAIAAAVPPAPDERREAAIAAALAAGPEVGGVTQLAAERDRRRGRTRILSAAAAAIVAIAVAVPVIASLGGDGGTDTVAAPQASDELAERTAEDTSMGASAMLADSDLGAISRDDLAAAVRERALVAAAPMAGGDTVAPSAGGAASSAESNSALSTATGPFCLAAFPGDLADRGYLQYFTATLDGTPVEIFVFGNTTDGSIDGGRAIAFEVEDCSIEADLTL